MTSQTPEETPRKDFGFEPKHPDGLPTQDTVASRLTLEKLMAEYVKKQHELAKLSVDIINCLPLDLRKEVIINLYKSL